MAKKKEAGAQSSYQPTESQQEDARRVEKRFQAMKNARANHPVHGDLEKLWDRNERAWEAYRKDKPKEDWQTDIYIPLTTSIIESQLSEVINKSPMPTIEPQEKDDIIAAQIHSIIWKDAWRKSYSDIEHYKLLKTTFIQGTGIWQETFLDLPRTVKDLVKFNPLKNIEEYETREIRDYYNVYGESLDLLDFFPDDMGRYFEPGPYSCRDAIRRYRMHIDDFREFFKGPVWDPYQHAQYVMAGGVTPDGMTYERPKSYDPDDVEVLWYWSRYPEDKLIIVANGVLVRSTPNPYKHKQLPFSRSVDYMRANHFYAKGEAEMLESIQDELNTLRRMRTDKGHVGMDGMFLVSSRENLNEDELVKRPHGFIEVDDVNNGIKPLEESQTSPNAYLEEDRLKEDAVRTTGIDDRLQSVQTGGTATESAILREATLKRIQMKMIIHSKSFLPRMAFQRVSNIQQYYSEPMAVAILGKKDSDEYKNRIAELKQRDALMEKDGEYFEKRFQVIPLKNKRLRLDRARGTIYQEESQGWEFFEARPEFIRGNVNIYFDEGSSLPISKPLEQQRFEAMISNPIMAASIQQGAYDLNKITDYMLRLQDINPEDFRPDAQQAQNEPEMGDMVNPQMEIKLAEEQNKMLANGEQVGPAPYVTDRHIKIHLAYAASPEFKEKFAGDTEKIKAFVVHVQSEIKLYEQREGAIQQNGIGGNKTLMAPSSGTQSLGGAAPEGGEYPASALQPSPKNVVTPGMITGNADSMRAMPR